MRRALRARPALPGVGILLPGDRKSQCGVLAEVAGHARSPAPCCVSGVRGAGIIEPQSGPREFSIDRVGGDYRSFELAADHTGNACQQACDGDPRCRAWTYLRPGYVGGTGSSAYCFLKDRITPPGAAPVLHLGRGAIAMMSIRYR